MRVRRVVVGPLQANCWLVDDGRGGPVLVVDPGEDAHAILAQVDDAPVAGIVLTHAHFDHVGAVDGVRAQTGAPLYVHRADADRLHDEHLTGAAMFGMRGSVTQSAERLLDGGERIAAGGVTVTVLHTPGHSPGGICLLCEDADDPQAHLVSGDTLFAGSVGRTDFPGGDARTLSHSIATQLAVLDPSVQVHPGHGPDTTIAREAAINPFWPR